MKKYAYIPTLLALVFLVSNCTLPAVHDPAPRPDKETKAAPSPPPEKPAAAARPETKGKRVSLIAKDNAAQTATGTPQDKATAPGQDVQADQPPSQSPQPPAPQPQIFTDYNTGLIFTYQRPWRVVSTQGEGSILGRDGQSQLTTRFVTLTTDKDKSTQRGYFYVAGDSIAGAIGKTVQSIFGTGDKQAPRAKTPLDVLLTQKHFPNLIIEKRYRGNDGGVIVQKCRHKQLPGSFQIYHVFIDDKVASFNLTEVKNRQLKLEMQQIVLSTRKP
ncbi:MAG: hypothetical protein NTW42_01260 [Deltaproteobacteria bacterium]|nr:hypothetical protein [Deltaproteobacteria bacterium]